MTPKQACEKHGIGPEKLDLFLRMAAGNVKPPKRHIGERTPSYVARCESRMKDRPMWAYIGGMRDALWCWVNADEEAYRALEDLLLQQADAASAIHNEKPMRPGGATA